MKIDKPVAEMTDLEFVKHWFNETEQFIPPILFRELRDRGLYHIVNLPGSGTKEEKLAVAVSRMAHAGHYVGEPEIEQIAGHIDRVKKLRNDIFNCEATSPLEMLAIIKELTPHLEFVRDYFKPTKIS